MQEGVSRFLMTDINNLISSDVGGDSQVQVMWDQAGVTVAGFNHVPGGSNVLFLDGHVSFIKYDGKVFGVASLGALSRESVWVTGLLQNYVGSGIAADTNPSCD